ncbi:Gibberellin 2-beta-dioxygenase 8 [Hordeum vulgare]|nr:Gibberellin 2-beta-dioxygenase 8 [Hordeum vulgare]
MEHRVLDVDALPSSTTIEHVMPCEGHDSPMSCEQLEVPESTVSVVPVGDVVVSVVSVADDVEVVGMLAPDLLEPSQTLASVDRGGSDVAVTHSHVTVGKVAFVRDKVDEILFELEVRSLLKRLEAVCPGSDKTIVEEALIKSKSKKEW